MNVANLELCKELYELSGWGSEHTWKSMPDGGVAPQYDLGYLLRKLPPSIRNEGMHQTLEMILGDFWLDEQQTLHSYKFRYRTNDNMRVEVYSYQQDDTPEDAACKLAIELFKQGVIETIPTTNPKKSGE